jgi:hypothetical protein
MARIAILIDWQNAYQSARRAFDLLDAPSEHGNFSPLKLGLLLAAGNGRGTTATLKRIAIFRGLPTPGRDSRGYIANRRQAEAWQREGPGIVVVKTRPLRYPPDFPHSPPAEKGVDVELAVTAVEYALSDEVDTVIVFSHDTDLIPAVEAIARITGPQCVETASWTSSTFNNRLHPKVPGASIYHHKISERMFERIATPINFARRAGPVVLR